MSFFDSEVVQSEMNKISELQEDVYKNVFKFSTMNKEEKYCHVQMLEQLLDAQRVLYTRLSLSDDPQAKIMKEHIVESAEMMGLSRDVDMNVVFSNMGKMLEMMREQIDKSDSSD